MSPSRPANGGASGGASGQRFRFDDIVVDAMAHTVERAGELRTLEPKAFAVLLELLRRPGEMIGRDDLLDGVWGHRHVTPGVLTRAIAQLRHALDDDFHHPRYIQTQHALGYRFIGQLQPEAEPAAASADEGEPTTTDESAEGGRAAGMEPVEGIDAALPMGGAIAGPSRVGDDVEHLAPYAGLERRSVPRRPAWRTRRVGAAAAVLSVLVAIAVGAWWLFHRGGGLPRVAEPSIAVLPFTTLSDEHKDRYFAEGLAVEMHDALAGVPGLEVVAIRPTASGNRDRTNIKTLGRRLGVASVLDASVRRDGSRVRISARLTDTASGFTLWAGSYDRELSDVFALQSEIANEVVEALLGVLPGGGQALARRLTPTQNIVAYDAYLKGLQHLQEPGSEEELASAIGFFRQALSADPVFARAQAGICRAEIARFETVRDAAAFERAQAACMRASSMDPALREVSLALGEMYRARGDSAKAIEQYTKALDDIALRPAAYVGLARAQGAQGRNELALDYFERARKLRPADASILRERGYHQYMAGDLPGAIGSFRSAITLQPDDEGQWSSLGGLYLASGDTARAAEAFQRSLAIKPNYAALSNYGSLKYEAGDYGEAADLFRHAAELDPQDFRIWGNIGDALAAVPQTVAQARAPYRRAADMAERYVGIKSDDAQGLALLCWYRANLGEREAALELLGRAESMQTELGEVAFWGAQTLALVGDAAGARARLDRAREAGIPMQRIRASPVLQRLLDTGRADAPGNITTG